MLPAIVIVMATKQPTVHYLQTLSFLSFCFDRFRQDGEGLVSRAAVSSERWYTREEEGRYPNTAGQ